MVNLRLPPISLQLQVVTRIPNFGIQTSTLSEQTFVISTATHLLRPVLPEQAKTPRLLIAEQHQAEFNLPAQDHVLMPVEQAIDSSLGIMPTWLLQFRTACQLPQNPSGLVQSEQKSYGSVPCYKKSISRDERLPGHLCTCAPTFQHVLCDLAQNGKCIMDRTTTEDNICYQLIISLPANANAVQNSTNKCICTTSLASILHYQQALQGTQRLCTVEELVDTATQARLRRKAATHAACEQIFGADTRGIVDWTLKCTRFAPGMHMDMAQCSEMRQGAVTENPLPHVFDATMSMAAMLLHIAQKAGSTDPSSIHTVAAVHEWLGSSDDEVRQLYKQCTKEQVICTTAYAADPKLETLMKQDSTGMRNDPTGGILVHMHVETRYIGAHARRNTPRARGSR